MSFKKKRKIFCKMLDKEAIVFHTDYLVCWFFANGRGTQRSRGWHMTPVLGWLAYPKDRCQVQLKRTEYAPIKPSFLGL
ncbi:MAG: hypothetical protein EA424_01420 [Planctomycetaceae bacterium]|nr:MAG: hypothetical protein EA424_01420 [Planctomycetaceae bacterium]